MGNLINETKYSCFNDCRQGGCPSHKMEVHIQTTSDSMMVNIDGKGWFGADPSEWKALKKMLKEFDYNNFDLS